MADLMISEPATAVVRKYIRRDRAKRTLLLNYIYMAGNSSDGSYFNTPTRKIADDLIQVIYLHAVSYDMPRLSKKYKTCAPARVIMGHVEPFKDLMLAHSASFIGRGGAPSPRLSYCRTFLHQLMAIHPNNQHGRARAIGLCDHLHKVILYHDNTKAFTRYYINYRNEYRLDGTEEIQW